MTQLIKTIDAHVGGQALRLIVEGMPRPMGSSLARKREWLQRHADYLRRSTLLEPRGHGDLTGAMLTEPVSPGAHAGIVFMDADGYRTLSGHGLIAATTIAIERQLIVIGATDAGDHRLVFDTASGTVQAHARVEQRGPAHRVDSVVFTTLPSFVHTASHPVRLGTRELRVDLAFGGVFHAIVDTEAIGIPLERSRVPELRRLGAEIIRSLNAATRVEHPLEPSLRGVTGVVFTGPPRDPEAHLRNVSVRGSGLVNRSPSGTGTASVMAVLDAMGLLPADQVFVHESLTGALFRGRIRHRTLVGTLPSIVAEIEGAAWITGVHTFEIDDEDPLREGFGPNA